MGICIGFLQDSNRRNLVGILWDCCLFTMGILRASYGNTIGFLGDSYGNFRGKPMGFLWADFGVPM